MSTIGQRLREIRGNTSQKDFANQFRISVSKYQRIEKGTTAPDADFLKDILSIYPNISLRWLISGKGTKNEELATPVDIELLGNIIAAVNKQLEVYDIKSTNFEDQSKGRVIALLYELFVMRKREGHPEIDHDRVNEYLKMAIPAYSGAPDGH